MAQWQRICLPTEEHWLNPWSGRTSHATVQLSPCLTTIEPELQSLGTATYEACVPESPCLATRETTAARSLCTTTRGTALLAATKGKPAKQWRPSTAIINKDTRQWHITSGIGQDFQRVWLLNWALKDKQEFTREKRRREACLGSVLSIPGKWPALTLTTSRFLEKTAVRLQTLSRCAWQAPILTLLEIRYWYLNVPQIYTEASQERLSVPREAGLKFCKVVILFKKLDPEYQQSFKIFIIKIEQHRSPHMKQRCRIKYWRYISGKYTKVRKEKGNNYLEFRERNCVEPPCENEFSIGSEWCSRLVSYSLTSTIPELQGTFPGPHWNDMWNTQANGWIQRAIGLLCMLGGFSWLRKGKCQD